MEMSVSECMKMNDLEYCISISYTCTLECMYMHKCLFVRACARAHAWKTVLWEF